MIVDLSNRKIHNIKNYKLNEIIQLDISLNELKELPKWIEFCINLRRLDCNNNKLTQLSEHLPVSLQGLNCYNNQLTQLPEHSLNSLQYLDCRNNQLTRLPKCLSVSLQWLYCQNNQLTELPTSLINCKNLTYICYDINPIENIHPTILRFINRQKDRQTRVYNDRQSVHNGNVQESVRQSIINILSTRLE
jgi:Leucine-rich repeat (LRR) protein